MFNDANNEKSSPQSHGFPKPASGTYTAKDGCRYTLLGNSDGAFDVYHGYNLICQNKPVDRNISIFNENGGYLFTPAITKVPKAETLETFISFLKNLNEHNSQIPLVKSITSTKFKYVISDLYNNFNATLQSDPQAWKDQRRTEELREFLANPQQEYRVTNPEQLLPYDNDNFYFYKVEDYSTIARDFILLKKADTANKNNKLFYKFFSDPRIRAIVANMRADQHGIKLAKDIMSAQQAQQALQEMA